MAWSSRFKLRLGQWWAASSQLSTWVMQWKLASWVPRFSLSSTVTSPISECSRLMTSRLLMVLSTPLLSSLVWRRWEVRCWRRHGIRHPMSVSMHSLDQSRTTLASFSSMRATKLRQFRSQVRGEIRVTCQRGFTPLQLPPPRYTRRRALISTE